MGSVMNNTQSTNTNPLLDILNNGNNNNNSTSNSNQLLNILQQQQQQQQPESRSNVSNSLQPDASSGAHELLQSLQFGSNNNQPPNVPNVNVNINLNGNNNNNGASHLLGILNNGIRNDTTNTNITNNNDDDEIEFDDFDELNEEFNENNNYGNGKQLKNYINNDNFQF
ncbi:unnamed protein product [[Candida] boidinii]|uniref:Unnamed protein product n=1 Tax=Candida boidinii TaxID=5477 RepID=A0ACB5TLH3_CANBO|nr:unnamed protein product [[Candida] boidinii]